MPDTHPSSDVLERVARAIARATIEAAEPDKFGRLSAAGIDAMVENLAVKFYPEARAALAIPEIKSALNLVVGHSEISSDR